MGRCHKIEKSFTEVINVLKRINVIKNKNMEDGTLSNFQTGLFQKNNTGKVFFITSSASKLNIVLSKWAFEVNQ